jgi:drug/metabolite transporter (DMT)-like permease
VDPLPIAAVLVSTISHAWWNLQAKRAGADHAFFGVAKWVEVLLYAPLFAVLAWDYTWPAATPIYLTGAGILVGLNYFALASAYSRIELGVAYPISRTSTLFLPFVAYFALGETIDAIGAVALLMVTVGVVLSSGMSIAVSRRSLAGIAFALLGALSLAGYTVWDKFVIATLDPFLYLYGYNCLIALAYLPVVLRRRLVACHVWHDHRSAVVQVAVLNSATYLLVLFALGMAKASYVGALRQVSLVIAVALGVWLLKEPFTPRRAAGVLLLIGGGLATTFAG